MKKTTNQPLSKKVILKKNEGSGPEWYISVT